jgi:hypothetical protein
MTKNQLNQCVRAITGSVLFAVLAFVVLPVGAAHAAKPQIDPSYANGQLVYMIGPHLIPNAIKNQPNLYAHSEELYLLVYPLNYPNGNATDPKAIPSSFFPNGGYHPNCDPCYHPGVPGIFAYHDHVLTGAPGFGTNGTAGVYKAPWKIILLQYKQSYLDSGHFRPITWASDIDAAELSGVVFDEKFNPNPNALNPYEIETGNVLICPLVSPHA